MEFDLQSHFDHNYNRFNHKDFIETDPISVPHRLSLKQDIEIIGFWTAVLSWGQRVTIINKSNELLKLMGGAPYDFVLNHSDKDLQPFEEFKHRTFNGTDALYFIHFLRKHYFQYESLETAFTRFRRTEGSQMEEMLSGFHHYFFDDPYAPPRTKKHIATPERKSTCKRLNMFMRWMVRKDSSGVDFGLWKDIPMSALKIPLDVHVERVARKYNLLTRKQRDWQAVLEITDQLIKFDPRDPVKYDFALFGEGVLSKDH